MRLNVWISNAFAISIFFFCPLAYSGTGTGCNAGSFLGLPDGSSWAPIDSCSYFGNGVSGGLVDMTSASPVNGKVEIQERNLCPSNYMGGTLYGMNGYDLGLKPVRQINGQLYFQWYFPNPGTPPVPGVSASYTPADNLSVPYGPIPINFPLVTISGPNVSSSSFVFISGQDCRYRNCSCDVPQGCLCEFNSAFWEIVVNAAPSSSADLSISGISFSQAPGTLVPNDPQNNPILGTTTPPTATPPPAKSPSTVHAVLNVHLSGTPSGQTVTDLSFTLGGRPISISPNSIDVRGFQQGDNLVEITFTPPTDPSLLGVLPLTATINQSQAVKESDYTNNSRSTNVDTMVICDAEEIKGSNIPFYSQVDPNWSNELYGIPQLSSKPGSTIKDFGCSLSDLAMLFGWYGISATPIGSPLNSYPPFPAGLNGAPMDPGSLNYAMANYRTNASTIGSIGFNAHNDIDWAGAAQVGRASHQGAISFKKMQSLGGTAQEAIHAVQNEICAGNAVILKVSSPRSPSGQHFLLAKAIAIDGQKNQTLKVNNPGKGREGESQFYSSLTLGYPSITGYILYHNSLLDPSFMNLMAPINVQLLVTDPSGRRTGFDPSTNTSYFEIPGADYSVQSINTPNEEGFSPSILVQERYFSSSTDVLDGKYQVQIFSETGGSYYLDSRSFDSSGYFNDSNYITGALDARKSAVFTLAHNSIAVPLINAGLKLNEYSIRKAHRASYSDSNIEIRGEIRPFSNGKIALQSNFQLMIGGVTGYALSLPASQFKMSSHGQNKVYRYRRAGTEIFVSESGDFKIKIRDADLSALMQSQLNDLRVTIDSTSADVRANLKFDKEKCSLKGQ